MKIIRMNLMRHQTRRDFGNGALVAKGVDYKNIIVWEGKDNLPYKKTFELYEDAIQDGFVHFQNMLEVGADDWMPITHASHHWNWCRILRYIATELRKSAIVMLDDIYFSKSFQDVIDVRDYAEEMAEKDKTPLKIVGLNYNDEPPPKHWVKGSKLILPEKRLFRGIPSNACDTALIITPLGAKWLLAEWMRLAIDYNRFNPILENLYTLEFPQFDVDMFSGIYCVARPEFILFMSSTIAPSVMHVETEAGTDFDRHIRPVEETRRER